MIKDAKTFAFGRNQRLASFMLISGMVVLGACQTPNLSLNRSSMAPLLVAPLRQPTETLPPNGVVEVRAADTLFGIATRYQVTPQSIIEKNGLAPPYNLRDGQILKIIAQRTHVVQFGDSINTISQRYAVSQFQLAQLNAMASPFELQVGQRLQLPNTLDFSVLDGGLPGGVNSTAIAQPTPTIVKNAKLKKPRKRFVAPTATSRFNWPLKGEIIQEFGPSARGVYNDGVNIAAASGAAVGAAANGRVAFVGDNIKSFGKLVLVKHDNGIITAYAHLDGIIVKEGDKVKSGQAIGTVGMTGKVDQPQLHFEIRKSRQPIDPRSLIS